MIKGRGLWFESYAREITDFFPGDSSIKLCRPIKEFVPKEIFYYLHSNDLTKYVITRTNMSLHTSKKVAALPGNGNFTKVLDNFLNSLQVKFSETRKNSLQQYLQLLTQVKKLKSTLTWF